MGPVDCVEGDRNIITQGILLRGHNLSREDLNQKVILHKHEGGWTEYCVSMCLRLLRPSQSSKMIPLVHPIHSVLELKIKRTFMGLSEGPAVRRHGPLRPPSRPFPERPLIVN